MSPATMAVPKTRDLRFGGTWTLWQRTKNDLLWALARAALATAGALPTSIVRAAGVALGLTAYGVARSARRTALSNIARVIPDLSAADRAALVRRCFATMGELVGDAAVLLRDGSPGDRGRQLVVAPEARQTLQAALEQGRGVLFASAHLGPWERVAGALVAAGVPLTVLARESYDPRFSQLYDRVRSGAGVRVIWRGSPGAATKVLRTLRSGGVLGIPMDLRARVASRQVPFLGHAAATPIGPARIALRARTPVVVGTAAPGPQGSLVVTSTPIATSDLTPGDSGEYELTRRINEELSLRILRLPHAWPWMHERWTAAAES